MKSHGLYAKIIKKEAYNDLRCLAGAFDDFEEYPIISRDSRLKKLQRKLEKKDISDFLLGLAVFVLNTVRALARSNQRQLELTAITFTRFDASGGSTLVPQLFIYPSTAASALRQTLIKNQPETDSMEMTKVKQLFTTCGFVESFVFLESRFFDHACNEELVRIYAIPRQMM